MERRYFFVGERFSPIVSASCSVDPFKPDFYEVVSHRTGFWPPGFATSPAREKRLWKCLGASRAARSTWSRIYDRGARRDRARVHRLDRVASSESNYYFLDETRATKQDAPSSGTLSLFQLFQEVCSLYHFFFFFLFSFLFFFFFLLHNFGITPLHRELWYNSMNYVNRIETISLVEKGTQIHANLETRELICKNT